MNGNGEELKEKFCLAFFPMSHISSLPREILDFEQYEKESSGVAWARFLALIHAGPDLSLPDSILLQLFCLGIDMDANLWLGVTAGGRFTHKTMTEQVEFLEHFIDKHSSSIIRTKSL
jgi:hypothetical protein